jgi:hypothetical protein
VPHLEFVFDNVNNNKTANDCYSDRQNALEDVKNGAQGMYVPECTPDNKYQRVQCHKTAGEFWNSRLYTTQKYNLLTEHNNNETIDISVLLRQVTVGALTKRRENPFRAHRFRTANQTIAITSRRMFWIVQLRHLRQRKTLNPSTNLFQLKKVPPSTGSPRLQQMFDNLFFFYLFLNKTQPAPAKESPASNQTWLNSSKRTWPPSWSIKHPTIKTGIKSIL